jgi:hypothetical protein
LHYTNADTTANRLTIALTEDSIITSQLNGNVIDTFYAHNYVMRNIVTSAQGDAISARGAGRVVRKIYTTMIDNVWKPENMSIVAFVHEFQNSKVVYQVKQISLK